MTVKRFTYMDLNFCKDNLTGEKYDITNPNEILDLLNNLNKENEDLRTDIYINTKNITHKLQNENIFKIENYGNFIYITMNNTPITSCFESYDKDELQIIVDLLNSLYEENTKLKSGLKEEYKVLYDMKHMIDSILESGCDVDYDY